jgi:uncharacterized protein YcgL (UPF0745 family)
MGYGCHPTITQSDRKYLREEARKLAVEISEAMTAENYKTFLTRDYLNTISNWIIDGADLDYNWTTFIAITKNLGLDIFINSVNPEIRAAVAAQGYKSSVLIQDENALVRAGVARAGYGLEILVNDTEPEVRCAVAYRGYALDLLKDDEDASVRAAVAGQGYKVDMFIEDKSSWVRKSLANAGYALDTLMFDDDVYVCIAARKRYLKNIATLKSDEEVLSAIAFMRTLPPASLFENVPGIDFRDMIEDMDIDMAKEIISNGYGLSYFVNNSNSQIRAAVALQGYGLDVLYKDEEAKVRRNVAKQGYKLDILVHDKDRYVRIEVAKQRYALDKLMKDEDSLVRISVVEEGYGLEILVNDTSSHVRQYVAKQGYGLDILLYDQDCDVRREVAKQGYGLDLLVYDKSEYVRARVAEQGYALHILVKDSESYVKKVVISQGYGLNDFLYDQSYGISSYAIEKIAEQSENVDEIVILVDSVIKTIPDFMEKLLESACIKLMNIGFPLNYFMKHRHRHVMDALIDRGYGLEIFIKDDYSQTRNFARDKMIEMGIPVPS